MEPSLFRIMKRRQPTNLPNPLVQLNEVLSFSQSLLASAVNIFIIPSPMPKSTDVVKRAAEFCSSAKFEHVFDSFTSVAVSCLFACMGVDREHADVFMDAVEAKGGDVEHKHEYKELHDKYLQLFEEELSDFVESEGATIEELFRECREVVDGHYTALFEEHQHAWFVDHLLASIDYTHFYGLMVNKARRLHRK